MITKIEIKKTATYDETGASMDGLKKVNFIYGSNGTGKTTISKLIANESAKEVSSDFADCAVSWLANNKLETFVYNRDFVEDNFRADENKLKGVYAFKLGDKNIKAQETIKTLAAEIDGLQNQINGLSTTLSGPEGKEAELRVKTYQFREKCWKHKEKFKDTLAKALSGMGNSKKIYADKLRSQMQDNAEDLLERDVLEARVEKIFGGDLQEAQPVSGPDFSKLLSMEATPILVKNIIGKGDVDIAKMIKKLDNSDWVRQGRGYFENNNDICPFCQQETNAAFRASLEEYFNTEYENSIKELSTLKAEYTACVANIKAALDALKETDSEYLVTAEFNARLAVFSQGAERNINIIDRKQREPSAVLKMEALQEITQEISEQIKAANNKIADHNAMVKNQKTEATLLENKVWRFFVNENHTEIDDFKIEESKINNATVVIADKISVLESQVHQKEIALREQESQVASIRPTIDKINGTLNECGFRGFSLEEADKSGYYKIVRPDGQDAHTTLSEGERSFITFLYFFHLANGSFSESGLTSDRVVVFDDPVSSLDSNVLFVVSTLIKKILKETADNTRIKQAFVLTHNIYFFKEVSHENKRSAGGSRAYWLVTKRDEISEIEYHDKNPIKSAYQMLWSEVKRAEKSGFEVRHTIQNTLRRILEYYFRIIGNQNLDDVVDQFTGDEQYIYQSLITWLHGGSHFSDEDYAVVPSEEIVQQQLKVFRKIFSETKQLEHYKMMRKEDTAADGQDI